VNALKPETSDSQSMNTQGFNTRSLNIQNSSTQNSHSLLRAARLCTALSLALLGGPALYSAQAQSSVQASAPSTASTASTGGLNSVASLTAYRTMASALDQAVRDRVSSSASSLADLDRASAAYNKFKAGIDSTLLTEGIDRVMQSARAALGRAPVDLEAQVVQARSLMRKALHDQTLGQLGKGIETTPMQAELLAGEFGLAGQSRSSFLAAVTARDTGAASRLLRSAAAQKVQASLSPAAVPQNSAQRTNSYLALARAAGWFTVVQDAPDTGGLKLPLFSEALTQLTSNNDTALATSLNTLKTGAEVFVKASSQAVKNGKSEPAPLSTASAAPPPPVTPVDPGPVGSSPASSSPVGSNPVDPGTQPVTPAAQGRASLDATYAALGRAQAAAGHADLAAARALIAQASQALSTSGLNKTEGFEALNTDLNMLQSRSGLRSSDVQAALAELSRVESSASPQQVTAQTASSLDTASSAVSRLGAPLWPLLFLLVGLASLYPMYLLNLAFGGRNNYWKAIAASLGLLFLPVLIEGLGGTLAYLGDLSGVSVLRSLGNLSLHQGAWGLPLWLLLAAVSVGLASYGFRGLCRQFGLLGGSSGSGANMTRLDMPQPALDWDEEI
jgi:hypothetical protein